MSTLKELAGIEIGDVIVTFDGMEIKEPRDLARAAIETSLGKEVPVILIRKGKEETRTAGVGARPGKQP